MTDNNFQDSSLPNNFASAEAAARNAAQIAQAARQGATALQHSAQVANAAARRGADVTAEVTRQGSQAGVEAMRRAGETANETVRRTTQVVAEGQRQIAQDAAHTFQETSRKVAQVAYGASEEVRRLATLSHAAEGGLRDMQQSITGLVEGVVQTNLRATQELFRLVSPVAIVELQQRFVRDYMNTVMQGTATLVRAVRRTADETLHPLEAQIAQRQQAQQSYRTAAE